MDGNIAEITIRIVNFDEILDGGKAIVDACLLFDISPALTMDWLNQYLAKNIEILTEV